MSLLAVKMWGKATGDANMEARGNLQLAILKRSLRNYFLTEKSNKNQPPLFIPNKESGIVGEPIVVFQPGILTTISYSRISWTTQPFSEPIQNTSLASI